MLESAVRGFHVHCVAWTTVLGEELTAEREPGNSEDPGAVKLKRGRETVGHVPCKILFNHFFMRIRNLCDLPLLGLNLFMQILFMLVTMVPHYYINVFRNQVSSF